MNVKPRCKNPRQRVAPCFRGRAERGWSEIKSCHRRTTAWRNGRAGAPPVGVPQLRPVLRWAPCGDRRGTGTGHRTHRAPVHRSSSGLRSGSRLASGRLRSRGVAPPSALSTGRRGAGRRQPAASTQTASPKRQTAPSVRDATTRHNTTRHTARTCSITHGARCGAA